SGYEFRRELIKRSVSARMRLISDTISVSYSLIIGATMSEYVAWYWSRYFAASAISCTLEEL
ncbi:MAG: hypothetical protein M3N49_13675, partial [Candidatus Eremiobacteraeota bacterium]|nr:hypothetical protein [Candidatus Eremiobacteraeota bacterium]